MFGQGNGDRKELQWQHWDEMGCLVLCQGHGLQQDQWRGDQSWGSYQQGQPVPWPWRSGVGVQGHHPLRRRGGRLPQGGTAWPGMAVRAGTVARQALGNGTLGPQPLPLVGEGQAARCWRFPGKSCAEHPLVLLGVACSCTRGHEPGPVGTGTCCISLQSCLLLRAS